MKIKAEKIVDEFQKKKKAWIALNAEENFLVYADTARNKFVA